MAWRRCSPAPWRAVRDAAHRPVSQRPDRARLRCTSAAVRVRLARALTLLGALAGRAERERDTLLPGYTHRQRAQPVSAAYYLCAWGAMFAATRSCCARRPLRRCRWGSARSPGLASHRSRDGPQAAALRSPDRQRPRYRGRSRFRSRFRLRGRAHAAAREPRGGRRDRLLHRGVRVPPPRRPDRDGLLDDAAEAEPGPVRADPGKSGRAIGNLNSLLRHGKGASGRVQPRLAGRSAALLETGPLLISVLRMLRLGLERVRFDPERGRKALEDGATAAHRRGRGARPRRGPLPDGLQAHRRPGAQVHGGGGPAQSRSARSGAPDRLGRSRPRSSPPHRRGASAALRTSGVNLGVDLARQIERSATERDRRLMHLRTRAPVSL